MLKDRTFEVQYSAHSAWVFSELLVGCLTKYICLTEFTGQHLRLLKCPKTFSLKASSTQLGNKAKDNLDPVSSGILTQGTYNICANWLACFLAQTSDGEAEVSTGEKKKKGKHTNNYSPSVVANNTGCIVTWKRSTFRLWHLFYFRCDHLII